MTAPASSAPAAVKTPTILYVNYGSDLYGASRCLLRMLGKLDRSRFTPLVLVPEDGPLVQALRDQNVEVIFEPGLAIATRPIFGSWRIVPFLLFFPVSVWRLIRLVRDRSVRLVHTNTGTILACGLVCRLTGVPHVWHIRDWFQEFRGLWGPYAQYIRWSSDRVIAISRAVAGQLAASTRVTVVHDALDPEEFAGDHDAWRRDFRERFALDDRPVIGCIGRIKFLRKGQEVLVEAAALLKGRGRTFRVVIVGEPFPGNEIHLDRLKKLIGDRGLEEEVVLMGELMDVRPALAAMDVFVLPSAQPEPLGVVILEAMAMGRPVVATRAGGPPDLVVEGETGFLVPPGDARALADALEPLLVDSALREALGAAGRRRFLEHFTLDVMCGRLERCYEELLPGPPPDAAQ